MKFFPHPFGNLLHYHLYKRPSFIYYPADAPAEMKGTVCLTLFLDYSFHLSVCPPTGSYDFNNNSPLVGSQFCESEFGAGF